VKTTAGSNKTGASSAERLLLFVGSWNCCLHLLLKIGFQRQYPRQNRKALTSTEYFSLLSQEKKKNQNLDCRLQKHKCIYFGIWGNEFMFGFLEVRRKNNMFLC